MNNAGNDARVLICCSNCHRLSNDIALFECEASETRKKARMTYYCIAPNSPIIHLCHECKQYLLGSNKSPMLMHYWPAMVYSFLSFKYPKDVLAIPLADRWKFIPSSCRDWWREVIQNEDIMEEEPVFKDVTVSYHTLKKDLKELQWLNLGKSMDRHLAYPEIRCPWGDSEFLHRVNYLPFGDFLWYASNYSMPTYQKKAGRSWVDGINPSYPSACKILEKFPCVPSMIMTEKGPMILCCRHHSTTTLDAYLHVPESTTGSIYTPNSNQYAPAVIRSRTLRNTKLNYFSDTYCTAVMQGGYEGFDSSFITSMGMFSRSDSLSLLRDSLSIAGRDDVRCHVTSLCKDPTAHNYVPKYIVDRKLTHAKKQYPSPLKLAETRTSTFVDIDSAVRLQEKIYSDTSRNIDIHYQLGDGTMAKTTELFEPPWPQFFVKIHPLDGYGQRFSRIEASDFGLWILLGITTTVNELWECLNASVRNNIDWTGHWLRFASKKVRLVQRSTSSYSSKKYFQDKKVKEIQSMFTMPLVDLVSDVSEMRRLFSGCPNVVILDSYLDNAGLRIDSECKVVVVVLHPPSASRSITEERFLSKFELRCLVLGDNGNPKQWRMFTRHARQKFWVQQGRSNYFAKGKGMPSSNDIIQEGRIAVFCRKKDKVTEHLRQRYMACLGGQHTVFCSTHNVQLVTYHCSETEQTRKCTCAETSKILNENSFSWSNLYSCDKPCVFACPQRRCGIAICQLHQDNVTARCNRESPETVMYLSTQGAIFRPMRSIDNDDGAIIGGRKQSGATDPSPGTLGPTTAFEIPQDLFSRGTEEQTNGTPIMEEEDNTTSSSLSQDSSEDMKEDELDDNGIPHTSSGVEGLHVMVEYGNDKFSTPLYIVLNEQGHLLTRYGSKLRMRKKHRAYYQKLIATSKATTIPLVYAEALLFPDIFWYSLDDGTIPGAFPTALWSDMDTLKRLGIAPMRDHARTRLNNPSQLCSTDPRYQFLQFDILMNLGLRGKDTRLILHRGFADNQGKDGVRFRDSSDSAELYGEASENHANVHKLAALVGERRPHYFFTQSCNQQTCRGLKVIREWVSSYEAKVLVSEKYGLSIDEASQYLRESAAPYVLRSWNEVIDIWMRYIIESEEAPLHKIEYAWYRKEFQG
jgi:hypothetical protein